MQRTPLIVLLLSATTAGPGWAAAGQTPARIEIEPAALRLAGPGASTQWLVTARLPDGTVRDVTRQVSARVTGGAAALGGAGRIAGLRPGTAQLVVRLGRAAAEASVAVGTVDDAGRPVSFVREIAPLLSKAGCNQGVCHGNANGKGGLKLSLRGQDPELDYDALARGAGVRRLNRAEPGRSLVLLKPIGALPHLGGLRFAADSEEARMLGRWIAQGAPSDLARTPALVSLTVFPLQRVLYAEGKKPTPKGRPGAAALAQQFRVTARYADGREEDVTRLACYDSSDDNVTVTPGGLAAAPEGGEAGINVRFGSRMQTAKLAFVPVRAPVLFRAYAERNLVDRLVLDKLRTLRLPPSPVCDDSTFIRRVYLDTLGFPPTPEEVTAFLRECAQETGAGAPRAANAALAPVAGQRKGGAGRMAAFPGGVPSAPSRLSGVAWVARDRLVERLLVRPEVADFWAVKWADLLRAEERTLDPIGMEGFYGWLRRSFIENKPMDRFARELLTATGNTYDHPAAAYYRRTRTADLLAENTAQIFMGVRLNCAKCHNHPADRWKQTDYHGMAAYFARVTRETKFKPRRMRFDAEEIHGDEMILPGREGEWMNPADGRPIPPRMLDDPTSVPAPDSPDRRVAFAAWLTRPDNPFFARAMTNRVWTHLMGRGIVDPVDDFRDSNPASIAPLLDALATEFARSGFDQRRLMRTILTSATYQLSADANAANAADERYFSHAAVRRLGAEQMLEAIRNVAGAPADFPGYGPETRVTRVVPTWQPNGFLRLFGQPARETVCDCERNADTTLGQSFELIGGRTVDGMLRAPANRITRLAAPEVPAEGAVAELYLAALARQPTSDEARAAASYLERKKDRRAGLEDLAWALMNTKEFLLRH